jgi:site-specific recombinase XerD
MTFAGIRTPTELRLITRAHVIAWRKDLDRRNLAPGSVRRNMSALSSLYEFMTDQNAVATNPPTESISLFGGTHSPWSQGWRACASSNGRDQRTGP